MLGRRLISAAVLALCLLAPATTSAAVEEDEGAIAAFQLKGSNGYRVLVIASRRPGDAKGRMIVLVGSRQTGVVMYQTGATVEPTRVRADLGGLGLVDLEYVPLKGKEKHSCSPNGEVDYLPRGEYRGIFELHGEEGFTEARATRLRATFGVLVDFVCGRIIAFTDSSGPGSPGARLNATLRRGADNALAFEIKKNRPAAVTAFSVSVRERRGKIRIRREIEGTVAPGAFRYDPHLRVATVSPPAPFDGSAIFRRAAPKSRHWTGNLTVDLPGRSDVPLVDPGMGLRLVHASWSKSVDRVHRRPALGRPLALLEAP